MNFKRIKEYKNNSPLFYNSVISSLDQFVLSGTSFIVAIILIRALTKEEFGYYAVSIPIVFFLISIQNATVNTPMAVLLPSKDCKNKYVSSLWFGMVIICVSIVLITIFIIFGFKFSNLFDAQTTNIAMAVVVSSIGVLLKEYLRAYYFAIHSPTTVLKLDICFSGVYLVSVLAFMFFLNIDIYSVFLLLGISSLLVARTFYLKENWTVNTADIFPSYRENWKLGRWALLGVVVSHIQSYSYLYLLGFILGAVAVADVAASRLLLMPVIMFQAGWSKVSVPYGAKLNHENNRLLFFRKSILISIILIVLISLYVLLLYGFADFIGTYLFSEKYIKALEYVLLWGVVFCIRSLGINASAGLQSLREFKVLSLINTVTMLTTLICAFLLITSFGIIGSFLAQIIGESFLAICLWSIWANKVVGVKNPCLVGLELSGKRLL